MRILEGFVYELLNNNELNVRDFLTPVTSYRGRLIKPFYEGAMTIPVGNPVLLSVKRNVPDSASRTEKEENAVVHSILTTLEQDLSVILLSGFDTMINKQLPVQLPYLTLYPLLETTGPDHLRDVYLQMQETKEEGLGARTQAILLRQDRIRSNGELPSADLVTKIGIPLVTVRLPIPGDLKEWRG